MKAKSATKFECIECGAAQLGWLGQCPTCGSWNTIELVSILDIPRNEMSVVVPSVAYDPASVLGNDLVSTGLMEFDRALSGGLVLGSTTLIGGEPGIGKSTLALHIAASFVVHNYSVLYVSAEESVGQVQRRALRIGVGNGKLELYQSVELESVLSKLAHYDLVIVDSIQAIGDPNHTGLAGSVNQVRHCAQKLNELSKATGNTVVILSHVTKDGSIAGPKLLEHIVDSVFVLDGERSANARSIRCLKNRFGKVSEVGYLTMSAVGLIDEPDQADTYLVDRLGNAPGSVVSATRDGNRIRLVEVQVLAVRNQRDVPKRQFLGFSTQRCLVILGMIEHFANIRLDRYDIFVSIAGGVSFDDPGLDLAVAVAVVSGVLQQPIPTKLAIFGELGLTGEIRNVVGTKERIEEITRRGFVFASTLPIDSASTQNGSRTLKDALQACGLVTKSDTHSH